jgi:hypothetical protein
MPLNNLSDGVTKNLYKTLASGVVPRVKGQTIINTSEEHKIPI